MSRITVRTVTKFLELVNHHQNVIKNGLNKSVGNDSGKTRHIYSKEPKRLTSLLIGPAEPCSSSHSSIQFWGSGSAREVVETRPQTEELILVQKPR